MQPADVGELFERAPAEWRTVLEKICDLSGRAGELEAVIPSPADQGRIRAFCEMFEA